MILISPGNILPTHNPGGEITLGISGRCAVYNIAWMQHQQIYRLPTHITPAEKHCRESGGFNPLMRRQTLVTTFLQPFPHKHRITPG